MYSIIPRAFGRLAGADGHGFPASRAICRRDYKELAKVLFLKVYLPAAMAKGLVWD